MTISLARVHVKRFLNAKAANGGVPKVGGSEDTGLGTGDRELGLGNRGTGNRELGTEQPRRGDRESVFGRPSGPPGLASRKSHILGLTPADAQAKLEHPSGAANSGVFPVVQGDFLFIGLVPNPNSGCKTRPQDPGRYNRNCSLNPQGTG